MNVKTFASMVRVADLGDEPLKITLCSVGETAYQVISEYDPENCYHVAAFGNWKIKSIIGSGPNSFELIIETINQIVTI